MPMTRRILLSLFVALPLAAALPLRADDDDHEAAAKALREGKIAPLRDILDVVARAHPGEVVRVKFKRKRGRWLYELKVLRRDNVLIEVYVDAQSKQIVKVEVD